MVTAQDQETMRKMNELRQSLVNQAELGEYDNASKILTKIIELRPDDFRSYMLRGEMNYMAGNMEQSVTDFDKVIELAPETEARLWQRGLALYYMERFDDGASQFEVHRTVNGQDVENAVWHFACKARSTSFEQAQKELMPIQNDPRVPMMQVHELYSGEMTPEEVLEFATEAAKDERSLGRYKYYAHFYIGLYYDAKGEADKAAEHMKLAAAEDNTIPKHTLMGQVANVHIKMRSTEEEPK
jgi:lipoprotein NlpI